MSPLRGNLLETKENLEKVKADSVIKINYYNRLQPLPACNLLQAQYNNLHTSALSRDILYIVLNTKNTPRQC